jgi:ribose-phosphate pyrophosphokinase
MNRDNIVLFAGNASQTVAGRVAQQLMQPLGFIQVEKFSDGETRVEILENIRGMDVFLIQSTCPPGNEHLMELLFMADACRRASAKTISAVVPYFGYSRQDRRPRNTRGPISAKLVADLIETSGISRLITIDLHADQLEGFFSIPVDNVYSSPVLLGDIWKQKHGSLVLVSPDVGGVLRARAIARRLDKAGLAISDKRREQANKSEVVNIIGDVQDKTAVIFTTSDLLACSRRLSIIAKPALSKRLAIARALKTPPTSGETKTRLPYFCFHISPKSTGEE